MSYSCNLLSFQIISKHSLQIVTLMLSLFFFPSKLESISFISIFVFSILLKMNYIHICQCLLLLCYYRVIIQKQNPSFFMHIIAILISSVLFFNISFIHIGRVDEERIPMIQPSPRMSSHHNVAKV